MEHDDKFECLPATANPLPPRRAQPRPYDGGIYVDRPQNTQTVEDSWYRAQQRRAQLLSSKKLG
jgi:hypothetical protein